MSQGYQQPEIRSILIIISLVSVALVLPGLQWSLFGWLYMLLPLVAFFLFGRFGGHIGKRLLLTAATISLVANVIIGSFDLFLFSCAMLLPGAVLHRSAKQGESPSLSGFKGSLTLAGGWLVVVAVAASGSELTVYSQMLQTVDRALSEALEQYRQSEGISAETLVVIEATIHQMKVVIPAIMPGVLGSLILLVTWATMVLGNVLLEKTCGFASWPIFRQWVLPEKLIWVVIAMGVFILIPVEPLPRIGINCILLLSVIYCFQGLSITVFLMNKWKVPLLLRSFFYVMIVFQSLGTLILLFFGIADIWLDFRKMKTKAAPDNK
ncbi:MAG: YybS family protein [Proteobacteria bacterium]|nr:YybS family protein [Pseudomonadota bacterium]